MKAETKFPTDFPEMRSYQCEAGRAVLRSVKRGLGRTITIEIARQGGKNELSAQIELFLLGACSKRNVEAVKTAPTFRPQLRTSMRRLWLRIGQSHLKKIAKQEQDAIRVGQARMMFLSAEPSANVVGHTASLLLEVDEAQNVDEEKFDRDFRPMAATSNATTVLYGTAWHETTLLERAKQANLEAERRDGERRHFEYDWQIVAQHIPKYAAFIEQERARLGETHPSFLTQYCLKTIGGGGRLLTPAQRAQLTGWHERILQPVAGEAYIAGLDLAGGDDREITDAPDVGAQPVAPDRVARSHDATVLTIGRLVYPDATALVQEPRVDIVEHYAWTGEPHETLLPRLIDLLRDVWRVHRVAVDATGLGETVSRLLASALGAARVDAIKFTSQSKSELGFGLLAAINGGRLKAYRGDGSQESAEFHRQCELARASYRANSTMSWSVAESDGHDDYLVSAALLVAASKGQQRRRAVGRAGVLSL